MKRRKLLPVFCLCIVLLMGCHKAEEAPEEPEHIFGEVYNTGVFQVLVPENWHIIPITDPFTEGRPVMTNCVFLRKGGESDWKVTEKPYIRIDCRDAGEIHTKIPPEDLQHGAEEIAPMELGTLTWSGYTADDYQGRVNLGRFAVLWAEDTEHSYQVYVWFKSGGEKISLEDPDVQAILAGVSASKE